MKTKSRALALLALLPYIDRALPVAFLALAGVALAGEPSKETAPLTSRLNDPWEFTVALPSWLPATSGTMGLDNHNAHIYIGADKLLRSIDMTASLSLEARKGRFGFYSDFVYVSASDGMAANGLVGKVDVRLDQYLLDMDLFYRVAEGPRGFLDLRAGVRYTNLYNKLTVSPNDEEIDRASEALVDDVGRSIRERLGQIELRSQLATVLGDLIRNRIEDKLEPLRGEHPSLPSAPLGARRRELIRDIVARAVDRRLEELQTALRTEREAQTEQLRKEARAHVDSLEKRIAKDVADKLRDGLDTTATLAEDWWDPYVGFRAQWNFSKAVYLKATGDIGGFGIGSDLTWQAYGALGCNLTRSIFAEAGYRYLFTDYDHDSFRYQISQSGAQVAVGITF